MKMNEHETYMKCKKVQGLVCASNDLFRMSALKWLKKMVAAWGFIYFSSKPHCS